MSQLKERPPGTDRETVMARLARKSGRGRDVIYHGTRHLPLVMRTGVLLPATAGDAAVFFSRSPEVAAYWGNMTGETRHLPDGGVLVLDRSTLVQNYRLLTSRYMEDWNDEREEVVWGRRINIRRHLLCVVRQADVDAVIGSPRQPSLPDGFYTWPEVRRQAFWRGEARLAADLVRGGRSKVREIIVQERETRLLRAG
ncbi:hypothetical protein ABIB66_005759 [Bradyrhizobium sp. F1.13.3]